MEKQDKEQKTTFHVAELEDRGLPTVKVDIPMPKVKPPKDIKIQDKPESKSKS